MRRLLIYLLLLLPGTVFSQDLDARSPKPVPGSHQQKVAEAKKRKQQDKANKEIEKGRKRHMKIQSKQTRKMMRKSKKKSKQWNENKKEFFLKRWFRKKNH